MAEYDIFVSAKFRLRVKDDELNQYELKEDVLEHLNIDADYIDADLVESTVQQVFIFPVNN